MEKSNEKNRILEMQGLRMKQGEIQPMGPLFSSRSIALCCSNRIVSSVSAFLC
ncbi:hypothetical protein [Alkalihalobacillus pseudalcaliphilus]|uniref:hypothetical protein n=1 Tax=Alkalihalobacillus pseudalcaliphilus TaxID=79884 RepID=UPI000A8C50C6|nr:hypothetical protein [Alkalihalobacillus pseudalcaliphilus]